MTRHAETDSRYRNLRRGDYITLVLIWVAAAGALWSWFGGWTSPRLWTSLSALTLLLVVAVWRYVNIPAHAPAATGTKPTSTTWTVVFLASLVLWAVTAQLSLERLVLLVSLSLASFMVGCLIGFLFTSYDQEKETVGKVKDWLIGGITALTITQAKSIKPLLQNFDVNNNPQEFALVVAMAVVYVGVGFFFMFFERELVINIALAAGRAERGRLEGTEDAGHVTLQLIQALSPTVLSGIQDVSDLDLDIEWVRALRTQLSSDEVTTFLKQADDAVKTGAPIDWDVTSKVANLHYYKTYFAADDGSRTAEAEPARQWILRALNINPLYADLTAKYADILDLLGRTNETVDILMRLERSPDAPAYVRQWLGYYLLQLDGHHGHEDESIRFSNEYHRHFPDDTDAFFNLARAYVRKYNAELQETGKHSATHSENYKHALAYLDRGLRANRDYFPTFKKKWLSEKPDGPDWKVLRDDPGFKEIVDRYDPDSKHHKEKEAA
jgi:tetratricopeptide (TPR) repeat protein